MPTLPKPKPPGYSDKRRRQTNMRPSPHKQGYDRKWRKVRAVKLARYPVCERCLVTTGQVTHAVLVHHIKPVKQYPHLRLVMSNLQSLCNACHEAITQRGGGRG